MSLERKKAKFEEMIDNPTILKEIKNLDFLIKKMKQKQNVGAKKPNGKAKLV